MNRVFAVFLLVAPLFAQSNRGELHLKVTDPVGLGVKTTVQITSEANQYRTTLTTGDQGALRVQRLSYGIYQVEINQAGFAPASGWVEIRSSIPTEYTIELKLPSVKESVIVKAEGTLLDPDQAGSVNEIGSDTIQHRLTSLPGRSMQDLVNSQPGWLYEGNAVLHPRGSEYQTQFVVDGIPLTDNRSPSFGPEIGADDVDSLSIYTAGFPAEYGRKMGGWSRLIPSGTRSRVFTDRLYFPAAAMILLAPLRRCSLPGARMFSVSPLPEMGRTTTSTPWFPKTSRITAQSEIFPLTTSAILPRTTD